MNYLQVHYNTHPHTIQEEGEEMEKFFTKREITEMLKVHLNTVDSWIAKGWLKAHKVGGRVRIYESDLQAFLNRDGNDQR